MKSSGEQYDDRIVEVKWDAERETWLIMRIRNDKPHGNYKGTVEKIIFSIRDGVELDAVSKTSVPFEALLALGAND